MTKLKLLTIVFVMTCSGSLTAKTNDELAQENAQLKNRGDKRTYNRSIFGNVIYSLNTNTMIGFELSHWRTEYKNADDGDSLRTQTSFIYKF